MKLNDVVGTLYKQKADEESARVILDRYRPGQLEERNLPRIFSLDSKYLVDSNHVFKNKQKKINKQTE
jgi:hypothetical protein